jgi:hypothetical protein
MSEILNNGITAAHPRRQFLKLAGGLAGLGIFATACKDDDNASPDLNEPGVNADGSVRLGSGDIGVLNYAYVLEQLEAKFYELVVANPFSGITGSELNALTTIRNIETGHRDFFKRVLGAKAIIDLTFDFSTLDFSNKNVVLETARNLEDIGVSAYNGAGRLLVNPDYVTIAGKIVSVEARNASHVRYMMGQPFFVSSTNNPIITDSNGLDVSRTPSEVTTLADPFIVTVLDASRLPSL